MTRWSSWVRPDTRKRAAHRFVPAKLAGEAWILHKPSSLTRRQVESFFRSRGLALHIETEISSPEAIKGLVRAGLGLSVLPRVSVEEELAAGKLVELSVQGFSQVRSSGLIVLRNSVPSRAAQSLRKLLEAGTL